MLLIPAIDLKNGKCVRLKQGDMDQATIFNERPELAAIEWINQGAKRLHLVDLDGAFAGKSENTLAIQAILKYIHEHKLDVRVQLGGGIRDLKTIEFWLDQGLNDVIIGTAAVKNPGFVKEAASVFAGHVIIGVDAKDGKVATDGWSKLSQHTAIDLSKRFEDYGVESIIYTDISRDGMLSGINIDSTVELARHLTIPVIASGGLHHLSDIQALYAYQSEGIAGVICGRAIYTGDLDFKAAQKWVDMQSNA
jgi:phosphoribosylformimino-5-aminoimidazole carboxamide ribotide isomerase